MHEILTLQLGHRANYLATHFWNTQESYFTYETTREPSPIDHDIHFRAGIGARGEETFTPRTLIYDLKGGFGGLKRWGGGYEGVDVGEHESKQLVWNGNVVVQKDAIIPQSEYQRGLDEGLPTPPKLSVESVRYWSDFSRVFFHPRSIVQINDYELGSTLMPFEKWENGEELFTSMDREVDLLDRDVRLWAEECDHMQGIQVFTGGDDAWGGFAAKYTERLRDEFGKLAMWVWGLEEEQGTGQKAKQLLRTVNVARSIHEISAQASMYVPISIPPAQLPHYVQIDRSSQWHTAALLSTALETMTLPTRLRPNSRQRGTLGTMEAVLNSNGNQRIADLQCSIADPLLIEEWNSESVRGRHDDRLPSSNTSNRFNEDDPQATYASLDMDLSCGSVGKPKVAAFDSRKERSHTFGQVESRRGFKLDVQEDNNGDDDDDDDDYAKKRRHLLPVMERYHSSLEYSLLDSFPDIFPTLHSHSVAIRSSLSSTSRVISRVKALQNTVNSVVGLDEREALFNSLGEISEAYEEGWQSDGCENDSEDYE